MKNKKKHGGNNRSKNYVPATKNVSNKIPVGSAVRSRDEYFFGGVLHKNHLTDKNVLYRKSWVVDTNSLDELALVKSTAHTGHHLKSNLALKFTPNVYIMDNNGNPITLNAKFVRSSYEDVPTVDVDYMKKRCFKFSDTHKKIAKLKSRHK
jgi:hypothetical protein